MMMQTRLMQAAVTDVMVDDHCLICCWSMANNNTDTVIRYTITPNTAARTISN
jgi:hypothetical protein